MMSAQSIEYAIPLRRYRPWSTAAAALIAPLLVRSRWRIGYIHAGSNVVLS